MASGPPKAPTSWASARCSSSLAVGRLRARRAMAERRAGQHLAGEVRLEQQTQRVLEQRTKLLKKLRADCPVNDAVIA